METKDEKFSILHRLPVALYHIIIPWLSLTDRLEFSRLNKTICHEVSLEARIITLHDTVKVIQFFNEKPFQDFILNIIKDPHSQLDLSIPVDYNSITRKATTPLIQSQSLSLYRLSMQIEDFISFLQNKIIISLQSLSLSSLAYASIDRIQLVVDVINKDLSDLKEFSMKNYCHKYFPAISSLQSLHIHSAHRLTTSGLNIPLLPNLRSLTLLDCNSIDDVSCLSHLYQLRLINCNSITKISCLNKIHTIEIISCDKISDYSQSFQHSVHLRLSFLMRSRKLLKLPDLDRMEKIRSLWIRCGTGTGLVPFTHSGKYPSTLRSLSIERVRVAFILPENHRLTSLRLSKCREVRFDHMSSIGQVILEDCRETKDISALRGNKKVILEIKRGFSDYFLDFTHLHLHNLSFGALTYLNNHILKSPKELRLHTIRFGYSFTIRSTFDWERLSAFACNMSTLQTFYQIIIDYKNDRNQMIRSFEFYCQERVIVTRTELFELFYVEFPVGKNQWILTKKESIQ